ncbi:alpha-2-macroglobulin family protein [Vibrio quintilis]|uniref:MG2 domain protein n=1 Tax=Vibrio quintilis TaxID=1117707 RepID=A0A1M7Z041_9VIBR|nr:MG2 domain-containing protein [Vibrio quintilis]SHO58175.1 MG2 domain protein [Vibrio quintilis]
MGKRICASVVLLLLFISCLAPASAESPKVTFIGPYHHQGKPALIVQFDRQVKTTKVARIFALEGNKDNLQEVKQTGRWFFNAAHTAVIFDQVKVSQRYRIRLLPQIKTNGDTDREKDVTVYERQPQVHLIGRGPVVPAKGSRTVPVSVVNAKQLTVEVLKVQKPARLLSHIYYSSGTDTWALGRQQKNYQAVTTLSFDVPDAEINQDIRTAIQLPETLENGWYILLIKITGDVYQSNQVIAHVLLTDMGIQAKVFQNQLSVLLNSFSGTTKITDAHVSILRDDKRIKLGMMKSSQHAFSYQARKGDILVIRQGKQMSVLPLKEVPLDLSDFQVTGRDWQQTEAFVYSNRTLFKPGDMLPLNIVLRDQDGQLLEKQRLYVEYRQPDGNVAGARWLDPINQTDGFYQDRFSIPTSAPLGKWTAYIKSNKNAQRAINQFTFNVSEFVPERMDMAVDIAKGQQNKIESLPVSVDGQYLFGAPAAGNQVNLSAYYQVRHHFDGAYHDFFVGQPFRIRSWKDLPELKPFKLDDKGHHQLELPLIKQLLLKAPVVAKFNFELLETGGASIQRNKSLMLWTGQSLPGIRPQTDEINAFTQARFDIGLLSGTGKLLQSGRIQYLLERNRGGYYWTYTEADGWQLEHDNDWQPVQSGIVEVQKGKTTPLAVDVEWGRYRLILNHQKDQVTRYEFRAGWDDSDGQLKPVKPDQLTMTLDKKAYQDGEQVQVTVNTDVAGELHLALESDKVEWHQEQHIQQGEHRFSVPLNQLTRHDLYLSATLISAGHGNPRRLFAVLPVRLDRKSRRLAVEIEPLPTLLPSQGADIVVRLKHPVKQPTWVTLSLVDKGIINLSRYRVPDIHAWFFDQRRYHADVIDLYSRLYQQRPDSFLTHRYGGDTELSANAHLDQTVEAKTITLMSRPVAFDNDGKAIIHVDIPDYNGQAQVVAMAFNPNHFGQAVTDVKIASPIVSELAVPRFLTPGDTSQTLLEVFNQTEVEQNITADLTFSSPLSAKQPTRKTFRLSPGERDSVAMNYRIGMIQNPVEMASLSLTIHAQGADGKTYGQQRSWQVPVRLEQPFISRQTLKTLPAKTKDNSSGFPQQKLTEAFWQGLSYQQPGPARLTYSHAPQLGIAEYADHLFGYPYGCAEQTTSKAAPWLLNDSSLESLKKKAAKGRSEQQMLKKAVTRLATMQKGNGSFALWDKHGRERPWVSVYVTEFLIQADQQFPGLVPEKMLKKAQANIARYPQKSSLDATRYYAAWVNARMKQLDYSTLWQLSNVAEKHQLNSPLSAAYLGAAWLLQGSKEKGEKFLLQSEWLKQQSRYADYDYGTQLRDQARILVLLSELEKVIKFSTELSDYRNRLAKKVMIRATRDSYLSTQERIALVQAGIALKALNQKPVELILEHDGHRRRLQTTGSGSVTAMSGDIVKNPNPDPLFVQVTTTGLASPESLHSVIEAKTVQREYLRGNGQAYHGEPLKMGEKLIVTVSYKLKEHIRNAMIVEYLPTGFVLENPARTNSEDLIRRAGLKPSSHAETVEYRNDRLMAALDMNSYETYRFNYVIRAETPGKAKVPALYMEDMYHPEWFIYQPSSLQTLTIKSQ